MAWQALVLFAVQMLFVAVFSLFSFFNYLYAVASLWKPTLKRTKSKGKQVALVVVCFNEHHVIEETIAACEQVSYENKIIVIADDSDDLKIVEKMRLVAVERGCVQLSGDAFPPQVAALRLEEEGCIEIWESKQFILIHREHNIGLKAGSLRQVMAYLSWRAIELMYILDADWHPPRDALEKTVEVIEADDRAAFVQTKRITEPSGINLFQKYVSIVEECCYYVDLEGRQALGHPILFTGACALFRLNAVIAVGGFTPGHLTEDLDLTNRLWLAGWKGIYLGSVVNHGEVPFTYYHYRLQQERWAAGTARALRTFLWPVLKSNRLGLIEKASAIRQDAYFAMCLLTGCAILLGIFSIVWIIWSWNSYESEYYLHLLEAFRTPLIVLLYWCMLANVIQPLVMILVKRRTYRDLLHLPMTIWYAWGVLPWYVLGNIKGLTGRNVYWFCTPKFVRSKVTTLSSAPLRVRALSACGCIGIAFYYCMQGWSFGWFDGFALLLIPAFVLASIR